VNAALTVARSTVTLAEVIQPPPIGVPPSQMFRWMLLSSCVVCVAALAVGVGRTVWTHKHDDGREAENTKWLVGSALAFVASVAAYQFMGNVT
jgi:hypothetical protein